jgi:glucan phosphoethanolaminetransferase (alkaline phosphatase superfamily)
LFAYYKPPQLGHYLLSVIATFSGLIAVQLIMLKWRNRPILFHALIGVVAVYLVITVAASVAFFYFNGFFPNYYTLEYFRTEPKSAMVLLRDSVNLLDLFLFALTTVFFFVAFRWVIRRSNQSRLKLWFVITGLVFVSSFSYLIYRHKKYDQCYTLDTNVSASFLRHVFELRKERKFEGRGLGKRQPLTLENSKEKTDLNVLVILCESLRKQNLGPYGYAKNTTPELDRFIAENNRKTFVFQEPYSVSSTTMLAVPAVLSGIAPYQSPELFYKQPLIWEFGRAVGARTFFLSSHTMEWYHFDRYYANEKLDYFWNKETSGKPFFNDLGIDDKFTIWELCKQMTGREPFFGVVQLNSTHYPYKIPASSVKWKGSFEDEYNNAIRYQDSLLGKVFDQLKRKGKLENTVIIFTSDHGESLKDHNNIGHVDSYYAEAISIPLIVYLPEKAIGKINTDQLRRNRRKMVSNIDIAPSLVDLLGLQGGLHKKNALANYSGYSLFSKIPDDRVLITMNNNEVARFKVGISVLGNGWHYLHRMNCVPNRQELYFTKWDKKEQFNLFGRKGKMQVKTFYQELTKYESCKKYLPKKD